MNKIINTLSSFKIYSQNILHSQINWNHIYICCNINNIIKKSYNTFSILYNEKYRAFVIRIWLHPLYNVDGENLIRKSRNRRVKIGEEERQNSHFNSARDSPFACRSKLSINVSWRPNDSKAEWSSMWRGPRGHSRAIHNLNSRRLVPHAVFDQRWTRDASWWSPTSAFSHVSRF